MDLKQHLKISIEKAVGKSGLVEEVPPVKVEVPKDKANGDFSTNIAMVLTKQAKRNPREIAQTVIDNLDKSEAQVKSVDIAGPGFINFKMEESSLTGVIAKVLEEKERFGSTVRENAEKILIEYVSANPTGDLHIGHARNASVGDTLANVMSFAGYDVKREYYINDAGNQIRNLALSIEARYLEALGQELNMPEDGYNGKDIKVIGERLAQESPEIADRPHEARIVLFRSLGVDYEMEKL